MNRPDLRERRTIVAPRRQHERLMRTIVVVCTLVGVGGVALVASARDDSPATAGGLAGFQSGAATPNEVEPAATPTTAAPADPAADAGADGTEAADAVSSESPTDSVPDLAIADDSAPGDDCMVEPHSLSYRLDRRRRAVPAAGVEHVWASTAGRSRGATTTPRAQAVEAYQTDTTCSSTASPAARPAGARDLARRADVRRPHAAAARRERSTRGATRCRRCRPPATNAPPLPENSGSGNASSTSGSASGSGPSTRTATSSVRGWCRAASTTTSSPGRTTVYSRSEQSTAWNGKAILPLMIRWPRTDIGAIGFHGIPIHVEDGSAYQTEAELGTRLSGGCQRQADPDARFLWEFADVGTTVVVL